MIRSSRWPRIALLVLGGSFILAACQAAPPVEPDPPFTIGGTIVSAFEWEPPVAINFVTLDPELVATLATATRLTRAAVELYDGAVWSLGSAQMGPNGSFAVVLPEPEELPAALMFGAEEAIEQGIYDQCSISVSDPGTQVLYTIATGGLVYPLVWAGQFSGSPASAVFFATINFGGAPDLTSLDLQSWIYAGGETTITGSCSNDEGGGLEVAQTFDLDLVAGWNSVVSRVRPGQPFALTSGQISSGIWSTQSPSYPE